MHLQDNADQTNDGNLLRRPAIADALAACRGELAERFANNLYDWDKYSSQIDEDRDGFLKRELNAFVDYLVLLFQRGDETYRDLYLGEKFKQLYDARDTATQALDRRRRIMEMDRLVFSDVLRLKLDTADIDRLNTELDAVSAALCSEGTHTARVLLIGDCLYLDLISFLTGPMLRRGITLTPTFLTSKNPVELRKSIQNVGNEKFDAVFYSPFTYEFSLDYSRTLHPRTALAGTKEIRGIAETVIADVSRNLDLLVDLFECNLFVHNSANIRRHDGGWKDRFKNRLTGRTRRAASKTVNSWLTGYCRKKNAASFPHLFQIDEAKLLDSYGEDQLGGYFYHSDLQHPAAMGRALSPVYERILRVQKTLLPVKLVVCDLDNTLWDGVIGEGAVEHFHQRQIVLQKLRRKGVLLAICSKNDPQNVHWRGGTLGSDDFVASRINWEPKITNIRRIARELNLKTKDFLFIDDRPDERAMVESVNPEIRTLDPTDAETWNLLQLWAEVLPEQSDTDRTLFYKQREQRQHFLDSAEAAAEQAEVLRKLDLRVNIRSARSGDLSRAADLINRTNQFNLCGSRTSLRELTRWHESEDWRVLAIDAADKFGEMGTISILVMHALAERVEIPIFVLSCRVFGYGIETAILHAVRDAAADEGAALVIHGLYKETPHNEPSRKVYPESGFAWEGDRWVLRGGLTSPAPEWLRVQCDGMRPFQGIAKQVLAG